MWRVSSRRGGTAATEKGRERAIAKIIEGSMMVRERREEITRTRRANEIKGRRPNLLRSSGTGQAWNVRPPTNLKRLKLREM
jgi:hypothetical protein